MDTGRPAGDHSRTDDKSELGVVESMKKTAASEKLLSWDLKGTAK